MCRYYTPFPVSKSTHLNVCSYNTSLSPKIHTLLCVATTHTLKITHLLVCSINTPFGVFFPCLQKYTPWCVLFKRCAISTHNVCNSDTHLRCVKPLFAEITHLYWANSTPFFLEYNTHFTRLADYKNWWIKNKQIYFNGIQVYYKIKP